MEKEKLKEILSLFESLKKELKIDSSQEKKETKKDDKKDEEKEETISDIEKLELEFVALTEENRKLMEDKLIAVADNQDTVRRYKVESLMVRKYGGEKLATELIPAIDMFRGVLKSSPDNTEIKNYLVGFEMIVNQIDQALTNAGVFMMDTKVGDKFDPEMHSAIEQVKDDKLESGQIVSVVSNGYKLHDRVIKHALVKVAE